MRSENKQNEKVSMDEVKIFCFVFFEIKADSFVAVHIHKRVIIKFLSVESGLNQSVEGFRSSVVKPVTITSQSQTVVKPKRK